MSNAGSTGVEVRVGEETHSGRAVDLTGLHAGSQRVVAAVRGEVGVDVDGADGDDATDGADAADSGGGRLAVACPDPRAVHEYVGHVRPSMGLRVRTALSAAARSRGASAPQDDRIEALRQRLADLEVPEPPETAAARRRVAGTEAAVERARERVAALRGRLQAGREAGRDVSDVESDLAEATRELSECETERAAAREALERAQRQARERRDASDRRRQLEDRLANLERAARRDLVERFRDEFADAVAVAPASEAAVAEREAVADPFETDAVTAALAVGRVADLRAPVVVACDRFDTPEAATDWLGAPVIRVSP